MSIPDQRKMPQYSVEFSYVELRAIMASVNTACVMAGVAEMDEGAMCGMNMSVHGQVDRKLKAIDADLTDEEKQAFSTHIKRMMMEAALMQDTKSQN